MKKRKFTITRSFVLTLTAVAILIFVLIFAIITFAINSGIQDELSDVGSTVENISDYNSFESILDITENVSDVIDLPVNDLSENTEISDVSDILDVSDMSNDSVEIEHGWIINDMGYTYVYNGCGYVQFNYKSSALERYVKALNNISSIVPQNIKLYSITVPVATTFADIPREVYVADNFYNQAQSTFVTTVASQTSERIVHIPIVVELESSYDNGNYVYYKTDKNWTADGAYIAYQKYCETANIKPLPISEFKKNSVQGYLGSFYNATKLNTMKRSPDEFVYYQPSDQIKSSLIIYDKGMVYNNYSVCGNKIDRSAPQYAILGRDAERYEINTTANGGSLLIIGDESVNSFVPFLLSHYRRIDIINPNRFNTSFETFFENRNYDDCLIMCYSTNSISGDYIPTLNSLIGATENG